MTASVLRAGVLALGLGLLAAARAHAQVSPPSSLPEPSAPATQPVTGFVPSYEIMETVRAAGFHPLAPPLREGTTYVLRATDFRGILMRVVVDARTGTIRDVNRIVPGPGSYGQIENEPPPYGVRQPFGPADYDPPMVPPRDVGAPIAGPQPPHTASQPPLPRPRPTALVVGKSTDDANLPAKDLPLAQPLNATNAGVNPNGVAAAPSGASPGASPGISLGASPGATSSINTEVMTAAPSPPAAASAPKKTKPAVVPLND